MTDPAKPFCPASERNSGAILEVLREVFGEPGLVLELGSGTGQHAVHFARHLPWLVWQPSDLAAALPGIEAWRRDAALPNIAPPLDLDVHARRWPLDRATGAFSANTAHILSWQGVVAMFRGVARILPDGACFCLYGPFNEHGTYTSEGNARLDAWARARDPESGLRDIADIHVLATRSGFVLAAEHAMPANNRLLVWRREEAVSETP